MKTLEQIVSLATGPNAKPKNIFKAIVELAIHASKQAHTVGTSKSYWLKKTKQGNNTRGPKPGEWDTERNDEIRALVNRGIPLHHIGKQFDLSKQRIEQIVHDERFRARQIIAKLVRQGKLAKPAFCCLCGGQYQIQMHHLDYNYPTLILWICGHCHTKAHTQNGFQPTLALE